MVDAKDLRIIIVCTFGAGSSQLLKMNVDNALRELGVQNLRLEVADSGTYRSEKCDGILTTISHEEMVKGHPTSRAFAAVTGIFHTDDIKIKIKQLLVDLGVDFGD